MTEYADIRGPARATRLAAPAIRGAETEAASEDITEVVETTLRESAEQPAPTVERPVERPKEQVAPTIVRRGPGFFPLLLGGVAAAALGFLVATYAVPEGWPRPETPDPEREARLGEIESTLAAVSERVDGLGVELTDLQASLAAIDTSAADTLAEKIDGDLGVLRDGLAALEERVGSLEEGGGGAPAEMPDFTDAFEDQMSGFEAEIDRLTEAAEAEVAAARAEAEETRRAAEVAQQQVLLRAALAKIEIALDTGAPFVEVLDEISSLDVPEPLRAVSEVGVTPLSELQRLYPEAARAALAASTWAPENDGNPIDRFTSFLMQQTNARSLEPREGDDSDAVLSRAEAALKGGDLGAALTELSLLEEDARVAMDDWLRAAQERLEAKDAVQSLAADIDAM